MTALSLLLAMYNASTLGNNTSNRSRQRGFTLLELLIALSIFTFISAAVFVGLRSAVDSYESFTKKGMRESELQSVIAIMTQDLLQIVPRVTRGVAGDYLPAFMLNKGDYLLEFSRGGLPQELTISGLQRVAYYFSDGALARYTWSYMDILPVTNQIEAVIITDITNVEITLFDAELKEHKTWPPIDVDNPSEQLLLLPSAIQISIDAGTEGKFERLIPGVSNIFLSKEDEKLQQPVDESS